MMQHMTHLHQPAGRLLLTGTLWSLPSQYLQHLLIFSLISVSHCVGLRIIAST